MDHQIDASKSIDPKVNWSEFQKSYELGGDDNQDRWNKISRVQTEFLKHIVRVGFLYYEVAKDGNDDCVNPFAELHCSIDPEKYGRDIKKRTCLPIGQRDSHFDSELADLLILLKEFLLHRTRKIATNVEEVLKKSFNDMKK